MTDLSVYLVVDAAACARAGRSVLDTVRAAVDGGVTAVQIREKQAPGRAFLDLVLAVADVVPRGVELLVNDRVDVFLAARDAGARVTGVHIGQDDLPAAVVRRLVGPGVLVGLSAATPAALARAEAEGAADYLGIGPVHGTTTKTDARAAMGYGRWATLAAATGLPAVAIGGVSAADAGPLRAAGAAGLAIASAVCAAADPAAAAAGLAAAWRASPGTATPPITRPDAVEGDLR